MNYMYGEKVAREIRDREVRREAKAAAQKYLDSLDEEDRQSARWALEEMFSVQRQFASQLAARRQRSIFDEQMRANRQGGLVGTLGLGGLI